MGRDKNHGVGVAFRRIIRHFFGLISRRRNATFQFAFSSIRELAPRRAFSAMCHKLGVCLRFRKAFLESIR